MKVPSAYDLDSFFNALHGKAWIEILTATQDEIDGLSRLKKTDPLTSYLQALQEFEAYLLNPTEPLPERYQTVIRNMRVAPDTNMVKAPSG
jgi:hypothetical protein